MDNESPVEPGNIRGAGKPQTKKKPYVKPAFRYERVFETQALNCGKIGSHGTSCKINPKVS